MSFMTSFAFVRRLWNSNVSRDPEVEAKPRPPNIPIPRSGPSFRSFLGKT